MTTEPEFEIEASPVMNPSMDPMQIMTTTELTAPAAIPVVSRPKRPLQQAITTRTPPTTPATLVRQTEPQST